LCIFLSSIYLSIYLFICLFILVPEFEFRALYLLGKHSTIWTMPPAHLALNFIYFPFQ
jgi:hypothetical protein